MDTVIRVNVVNFITIGLMAFIFIFLLNTAMEKFLPALALSTAAMPAPATAT